MVDSRPLSSRLPLAPTPRPSLQDPRRVSLNGRHLPFLWSQGTSCFLTAWWLWGMGAREGSSQPDFLMSVLLFPVRLHWSEGKYRHIKSAKISKFQHSFPALFVAYLPPDSISIFFFAPSSLDAPLSPAVFSLDSSQALTVLGPLGGMTNPLELKLQTQQPVSTVHFAPPWLSIFKLFALI